MAGRPRGRSVPSGLDRRFRQARRRTWSPSWRGSNALGNLNANVPRKPGRVIANQMPDIAAAMADGQLKVLLLLGTNMLSSFADAGAIADSLARMDTVVSVDLFMNETARRYADVVLPGTAWLEETGFKATNTISISWSARWNARARRGRSTKFLPRSPSRSALRTTSPGIRSTEYSTPCSIIRPRVTPPWRRCVPPAEWRRSTCRTSPMPIANSIHPSGKIEFYSSRAEQMGLPPMPVHKGDGGPSSYPLTLTFGRTLTHFHSFYNEGQALPSLAKHNTEPPALDIAGGRRCAAIVAWRCHQHPQ